MDDKIQEALNKYYDMFGNGFPTIPLFLGGTDEENLKMVNEYIKKKKDAVEMGYYKESDDILY